MSIFLCLYVYTFVYWCMHIDDVFIYELIIISYTELMPKSANIIYWCQKNYINSPLLIARWQYSWNSSGTGILWIIVRHYVVLNSLIVPIFLYRIIIVLYIHRRVMVSDTSYIIYSSLLPLSLYDVYNDNGSNDERMM